MTIWGYDRPSLITWERQGKVFKGISAFRVFGGPERTEIFAGFFTWIDSVTVLPGEVSSVSVYFSGLAVWWHWEDHSAFLQFFLFFFSTSLSVHHSGCMLLLAPGMSANKWLKSHMTFLTVIRGLDNAFIIIPTVLIKSNHIMWRVSPKVTKCCENQKVFWKSRQLWQMWTVAKK